MIAIGRKLIKSFEWKYHLTCAWVGCSLLCPVASNLPVMSCADAALETAVHTGGSLCVCVGHFSLWGDGESCGNGEAWGDGESWGDHTIFWIGRDPQELSNPTPLSEWPIRGSNPRSWCCQHRAPTNRADPGITESAEGMARDEVMLPRPISHYNSLSLRPQCITQSLSKIRS